jgi:curved DNA-binding protein
LEYRDYYATLGVPRNADQTEIKRAYRKLARQVHPDVNADKAYAERRFKEINEAYTVLSDPEKRRKYDRFGAEWSRFQQAGYRPENARNRGAQASYGSGYGRPTGQARYSYTGTMSAEEFARIFGAVFGTYARSRYGRTAYAESDPGDFSDFFEALFGNRWRQASGAVRQTRGQDAEVSIQISLTEAYRGTTRILRRNNGRRIEVTVPAGVDNGTRIRIAGQGEPGYGGGPAGDLYLKVEVLAQADVTRLGDDLRLRVPIAERVARRGGSVKIPSPGGPVRLSIPGGTRDGQILRVSGQGMPNLHQPEQRGDLLVEVTLTSRAQARRQRRRLGQDLGAKIKQAQPAQASWLSSVSRLLGGLGLFGIGLLALLWQLVGLNGAGWLLLPAFTLLFWAAVTRSGRSALAGGSMFVLTVLMLNADSGAVVEVLRWLWPLCALAGGGYLAIKSGLAGRLWPLLTGQRPTI